MKPTSISDEETGQVRLVIRECQRCHASKEWDYGFPPRMFEIASPAGVAHWAHPYNEGWTLCGIDATGDGWWHRC
jgi:hypothetical protein